jgi:hypothetical protein
MSDHAEGVESCWRVHGIIVTEEISFLHYRHSANWARHPSHSGPKLIRADGVKVLNWRIERAFLQLVAQAYEVA